MKDRLQSRKTEHAVITLQRSRWSDPHLLVWKLRLGLLRNGGKISFSFLPSVHLGPSRPQVLF